MKSLLLFIFAFVLTTGFTQSTSNSIVIGTIDSIYSKVLNERRKIWVYVPNTNNNVVFSQQHYPVVYLLDGDAHFNSVMGMIQQLSEVNGNTLCPEMIIVGIPNTDRTHDLTPTHVSAAPYMDSNFVKSSGGGEKFTLFLEKELMPHIDSIYPTAPYRMLIGHSFGGLMVINTFINHTTLFNSYLAIDPSLWWDNQKLLKQADKVLHEKKFDGKTLFLAVANTMEPGMDTLHVRRDTAVSTLHIRSILQFANVLKGTPGNGLRWSWKYYNEDEHNSVPLIAEYDAVRFIFNYYKPPSFGNLFDSSFHGDSALIAHFKNVSTQMGYNLAPPEPIVNQLGYVFLQRKMFSRSYSFFQMNITNYPNSFNVYDSMGDYYDAKGDKQKAIQSYTKALSLKDWPDTRKKLEKLKAGK